MLSIRYANGGSLQSNQPILTKCHNWALSKSIYGECDVVYTLYTTFYAKILMEYVKGQGKGSLVVVGTGISVSGQLTLVTCNHIKQADLVFTAIPNKPGIEFIKSLNSNLYDLTSFYKVDKARADVYQDMVTCIIDKVHAGFKVCAAFYGHPGVFVDPSHTAIELLKSQGYDVKMEPGISAEDCLIADLGIDPAAYGCQSYEATQFLLRDYVIDPHMTQIIWQVFNIAEINANTQFSNDKALALLVDKLAKYYPLSHEVIIYEAKTSPIFETHKKTVSLGKLTKDVLTSVSTLVIPSIGLPKQNQEILSKLN